MQWAKLVLNLNNPINALSNLPLKTQLSGAPIAAASPSCRPRRWHCSPPRGHHPGEADPLPPAWIPWVLAFLTPIFTRLAGQMLAIDPQARSSMWEDLEAGTTDRGRLPERRDRPPRRRLGRTAPVNARLGQPRSALPRAAASRTWSGPDLLADLTAGC